MKLEVAVKLVRELYAERAEQPEIYAHTDKTIALEVLADFSEFAIGVLPEEALDIFQADLDFAERVECDSCHKPMTREQYIVGKGLCEACIQAINQRCYYG